MSISIQKRVVTFAVCCLLLCSASAFAATYKLGDEASEISTIQSALKQLKFYTGDITGHYGSRTEDAVIKFQKKYNLSPDGIVGRATLEKLYDKAGIQSSGSSSSSSKSSSSSSSSSVSSSLLRYGSEGESVRQLQTNLAALGFYSGSITGHYGSKTEAAVASFQRANGLTADGIAGTKTLASISAKASKSSSSSSSSSSSGTSLNTSMTVSSGSKNDNVKKLQQMLKTLGYYTGSITGSFGSKTKDAVIAFQKSKGLTADGIAGSKTLAAINSDYKNGSSASSSASSKAANVLYSYFVNWRNRYANGEYCTVYDPATGYSWKLRIMTKDAHMDAEPVTASDTATMNKAFGKTTWTPKVVYVTFSDGKTYIGSTHNTPHGTSHVGSNNFSGHLCVHFPMTMEKAQSIGSYAVSHQEAINAGWEKVKALQY